MITVNIGEAKDRFSELIRRVEDGEEVVIARDGAVVAEIRRRVLRRTPGALKGQITVREDFDDPLPDDVLHAIYEKSVIPDDV